MGMKISSNGIKLIKQFEGCRLTAYKCSAGVLTIGYGHTGNVVAGQKITQVEADNLLIKDLEKFEQKVNKYFDKYKWNQNEFDALVSFAFNVGSIDKLTAKGTRNRAVIAEKIPMYNKAAGKVLAGLTRRRKAEQELFLEASGVASDKMRAIIRKGSRGEDVIYLQKKLTDLGYSTGKVDGVFGEKTLKAVECFQLDHGLIMDGVVGSKTWDKIK